MECAPSSRADPRNSGVEGGSERSEAFERDWDGSGAGTGWCPARGASRSSCLRLLYALCILCACRVVSWTLHTSSSANAIAIGIIAMAIYSYHVYTSISLFCARSS